MCSCPARDLVGWPLRSRAAATPVRETSSVSSCCLPPTLFSIGLCAFIVLLDLENSCVFFRRIL